MSFTYITGASAAGTTAGIDTTGANLLVAVIAGEATSITDSRGNVWLALTQVVRAQDNRGQIFYCFNPIVGTGHTFSSVTNTRAVSVAAFSGSASSPFDKEQNTIGNGSPDSGGSVTPTNDNSLIISALPNGGTTNTFSVNSGFTIASSIDGVSNVRYGAALAYLIQGTKAAINSEWTFVGPGGSVLQAVFSSGVPMPTLGIPTFVPGSVTLSGFRPRFPVTWA